MTGAGDHEGRWGNSRAKRLAGNTVFQGASAVGVLIVGLIVTPVSVSHLGLVSFGLWGYVSAISTYLTIIDPGFSLVVSRQAAQARSPEDRAHVRRLVALGILAWFVFLSLLSPLVFAVITPALRHFHLTASQQADARQLFLWAYVFVFLSIVSDIVGRILVGVGLLWVVSLIDLATRVLYGILGVALLLSGYGLSALMIASTAQLLVALAATWIAIRRNFGPVLGNPFRLTRSTVSSLARSGGSYQLACLLGAVNSDTDPFVIGRFVGSTSVGIYSLASRLAGLAAFLPGVLQRALFPFVAASRSDDEDHDDVLRSGAISGNRYTAFISFTVGFGALALAPVVYRAWVGKLYPGVDSATALLLVAALTTSLGTTAGTVLLATGRISATARITAAGVVANVALTISLAVPLGVTGVLLGTVVADAIVAGLGVHLVNRQLGISMREAVWTWLWRLTIATGVPATICRAVVAILPAQWKIGRLRSLEALALLGLLYVVLLVPAFVATGFFSASDRELIKRVLPTRLISAARFLGRGG